MFDFLLTTTLRVSLLLMTAWLATALLRRSSASLRHGIWTGALIGTILIPCLALLPGWQALPALTEATPQLLPVASPPSTLPVPSGNLAVTAIEPTTASTPELSPAHAQGQMQPARQLPWLPMMLSLWALGTGFFLLRIGMATQTVYQLTRSAVLCDAENCKRALVAAMTDVGTKAAVTLLVHPAVTSPMTWGMREPVIILPEDATTWSHERLHAVLTHECAHIARRDFATQLSARIARALYWFHPLAWLAAYKLHLEQERACDDAVLQAGGQASSYAEDLLAITKKLRPMPRAALVTTAIARPSELVSRMRYLLDSAQARRVLGVKSRSALVLVSTSLCLVVGISRAVTPEPESEASSTEQDPKQDPDLAAKAERLVGMLDLASHRKVTIKELIKIGKPAIPALTKAVEDKRLSVVRAALTVLVRIPDADDKILPPVIRAFDQHADDPTIRRDCNRLFRHHLNNKSLIEALVAGLSTEDTGTNEARLWFLAGASVSKQTILIAVTPLCASNTKLSQHALTVVFRQDPHLRNSRNVVLQALDHKLPETVAAALSALTRARVKDETTIAKAKTLLQSPDLIVQDAAKHFLFAASNPAYSAKMSAGKPAGTMPALADRQFLIADYSQNRILIIDAKGEEQLVFEEIYGAWDAEPLPNGNILITEFALNRIKEITRAGKEVWSFDDLKNPNDADRLPNGNTLIADTFGNRVIEVNPAGEIIWIYAEEIKPYDVERLPNGNTLIADGKKDMILEVDTKGDMVWAMPSLPGVHDVDLLANGNLLVTQRKLHRVLEIDRAGKTVWSVDKLASPSDADRLPDGTTIIAENGQVSIFDKDGKPVWTYKVPWAVEVNMIPAAMKPAKKGK